MCICDIMHLYCCSGQSVYRKLENIRVENISYKKKFCAKKIHSYTGGLGKFLTCWQKGTSFEHAAQEFDRVRDL